MKFLHCSEQLTQHHPLLETWRSNHSKDVAMIKESNITHFQSTFDVQEVPSDQINRVAGQVASTEVTSVTEMRSSFK